MMYFIARPLVLLVLAALAAGASNALASSQDLTKEQMYQLALEAQSHREYDQMLAHLHDAAQAGHQRAQEMLGVVLLQGPTLFGSQVARDTCAAYAWLERAAQQGSEMSRLHLDLLNRQRAQVDCCRRTTE